MQHESWLEGTLPNILPILQPAAHALVQARRDVENACNNLTLEQIWTRIGSAPSAGFHLLHIAGSINRLLTYARGEDLNEKQFAVLKSETEVDQTIQQPDELVKRIAVEIETALAAIAQTRAETLFKPRGVGRQKLPTTVFGLLFHIAEHTQRHVGAIVTLSKIV